MGYIPRDARWFIAELVVECRIEEDPRNVLHVDHVLVRADSAEEAYTKALELGADKELAYVNTEDKKVVWHFRGLRDLFVVHDELEHGGELLYEEEIDVTDASIQEEISTKESLSVFREVEASGGPNYMPRDLMAQVVEALGKCALDGSIQRPEDQN
jgi:Domain of unknown function (DUF4288)